MRIPNDQNLFSVANLGVQFQIPYHVMQTALDVISAEPALALNGVSYFMLDDERIGLIHEYLDTRRHNDCINRGSEWKANISIPRGYQRANQ